MIQEFLASVIAVHKTGNATEHSYRPALQKLFNAIDPKVSALNEPKREKVGAPDFSISRGDIVIGHCEAKDIPVDLKALKDANKAQKDRYVGGLSNLLYTNCLEWIWYRDGEKKAEVRIADFLMGIQPIPDQFAALENLLREFVAQTPQTITSSRALAERMAGKARLIKDILANALMQDKDQTTELRAQYEAFKTHLIHDIQLEEFADIYAETITYGMFAARLNDRTLEDFSRQEALELLPKSNPFLRNLFSYIAGPNLDERIVWIIDDLAKVFQAADVFALMERYGKTTQRNDPFLHFYEDFLKAYNPAKRDARGVWYTPEPVVNFIVRAVDDVLKSEFGLADGLADTSKVTIDWDTGQTDKKGKPLRTRKEVHRVQILDPATGTGTFLAETIKLIAPRVRDRAPGMWSSYVEKDLIPRLHGFELLMASYAMCHLKLDMVLKEHGYKRSAAPPRVSVYLTNSLEEGEPANQSLPFAQWLSNEVKEANTVKRDMPIMCIIGNPPYSGESSNKSPWIMGLMEAYKKEPGGKEKLKERNPKWINDDYVKFIRMSEHLIERNGEGVLGFITNHGYLDNPTFRGMRWHLLKTFDKIYVIDLHGNAKKKEVSPDGSPDKNVFDIQQGVAIVIGVKHRSSVQGERGTAAQVPLAQVYHSELWGDRKGKYDALWEGDVRNLDWALLENREPQFVFAARNFDLESTYRNGFSASDLFPVNGVGMVTARDHFVVGERDELIDRFRKFQRAPSNAEALHSEFKVPYKMGWSMSDAHHQVRHLEDIAKHVRPITYRPFDNRYIFYHPSVVWRTVRKVMRHMEEPNNFGLSFNRTVEQDRPYTDCFVFRGLIQHHSLSLKEVNYLAPLYLYPSEDELDQARRINFDPKLYARLRKLAKHPKRGEPDEVAVFDYIYGVLHCPAYRETYAEFLKIDFPRIPWPASPAVFWDVSDKGAQLRRLHLMEPAAIGDTPFPFTGTGNNTVEKIENRDGAVWINETQRFERAPEISWSFWIGGYQPAQKWLKDRKGRTLDYEDVQHYQRILKILAETDRIMKTIDMPLEAAESED